MKPNQLPPSVIYLLQELDNPIYKIGKTEAGNRSNLTSGNCRPLKVVKYWPVTELKRAEDLLHGFFEPYNVKLGGGKEFFQLPDEETDWLTSISTILGYEQAISGTDCTKLPIPQRSTVYSKRRMTEAFHFLTHYFGLDYFDLAENFRLRNQQYKSYDLIKELLPFDHVAFESYTEEDQRWMLRNAIKSDVVGRTVTMRRMAFYVSAIVDQTWDENKILESIERFVFRDLNILGINEDCGEGIYRYYAGVIADSNLEQITDEIH